MSEKRSCENCGNIACANSIIAIHYDECVKSGYSKHWKPKENECTLPPEARKKDCGGCEGCGWERAEAASRRAYLKENKALSDEIEQKIRAAASVKEGEGLSYDQTSDAPAAAPAPASEEEDELDLGDLE